MGYALTTKRQVTIPIQICEQLGIGPGREIEYVTLDDGRVVIVPTPEKSVAIHSAIPKMARCLCFEENYRRDHERNSR
jgi:AbrB family looped-hinge helix DNA binding protein